MSQAVNLPLYVTTPTAVWPLQKGQGNTADSSVLQYRKPRHPGMTVHLLSHAAPCCFTDRTRLLQTEHMQCSSRSIDVPEAAAGPMGKGEGP